MSSCRLRLVSLFLFAAAATPTFGQSFTAGLRGVIADQTGSSIPGASISVTNVSTGVQQDTESDAIGRYNFAALAPGEYTLRAEAPGFAVATVNPFTLTVQQQATIDVELTLGEVTTTIEVGAEAPLLNTTIANLGQTVENKFVVSLPLAGRNPMSLTYLAAGVTPVANRAGGQSNTNFVANGARNSSADVLLDGVTVTNVEQNSGVTLLQYTPSVDSVQEFKIQTNFFSAEYGNTGGAVINMVTKGGGNEYHGVGYEFHRNSALNANNWFSNRAGRDIPDFTRNVFGGNIGGPISKNKAFFFVAYERTNQEGADSRTSSLPTLLQRDGDFSQTFAQNGTLIQNFNPFDTYVNGDGDIKRRPFSNNVIPQSMMDPVALNALAFYPEPNQVGNAVTNANNWFDQGTQTSNGNRMDNRLDYVMSDKNRLSARYSTNWGESLNPDYWGNGTQPFFNGNSSNWTHNGVLDWTRTHSPTTIITVRYGHLQQRANTTPMSLGFSPTELGLPSDLEYSGILMFPSFQPEGFENIGVRGWGFIARDDSVDHLTGSVTKVMGGHSLKIGGEWRRFYLDYRQPGYPQGGFQFNRQVTREDRFAGDNAQGNGLASMLLGWGSGGNYHIDPRSFSKSRYYGGYIQDDWRVTDRLTLNLGLRYDFDVPRVERENRYSWFDFDVASPIAGQIDGGPDCLECGDLRGAFFFADDETRSPHDADLNNWQPRFGFALRVTEKMSLRGGYGLFYTTSRASVKGHLSTGFQTSDGPQWSLDSNATQFASLSNPYPNGLNIPLGAEGGPETRLGFGFGSDTRDNQSPQYHNWNLSLQRSVGRDGVLEVNYTGSRGVHLYFGGGVENLNRLYPTLWTSGRTYLNEQVDNPFQGVITDPTSSYSQDQIPRHRLLRPFPHYAGGASGNTPNIANSIYHAGQVRYEKRFSEGLTMLAHYTFAKMIDDSSFNAGNVSWLGGSSSVQDFTNLRAERAVSTHDIRHRVVSAWTYQLPIGRGRAVGSNWGSVANALLGGWEVNGMLTLQGGSPIIPTLSGGTLWEGSQRPNLIGDPDPGGSIIDRVENGYFNADAFSRPAPDTYGTAPRTLRYRNPGLRNIDLALFKSFAVTEAQRFEFRFETFNTTNTPIFGQPNASFGSTAFGNITGLAAGASPRTIQLGFKYYF